MTIVTFDRRDVREDAIDPVTYANWSIQEATNDFTFAMAAAFNAKDLKRMAEIMGHMADAAEYLVVALRMAQDFQTRCREES